MTFVVPFDGSGLAEAALVRAAEFSTVLDERVLAVAVIPRNNTEYARKRGWIDESESFDRQSVVATLHQQVTDLVPAVDFQHEIIDKYAPVGAITNRIRHVTRDVDASMVFVGSENAGRMVTGLGSVGSAVTAQDDYDVVIVRNRAPSKIAKLKNANPIDERSDFYVTDG
jgi:nucleotide-binding universal stress UspA family protein